MTSELESAVKVRGLRKTYKSKTTETTALAGVDLDIHAGEIFALLGPNGAGKTTMVEILEGYRDRDAGAVSVLGVDPADADNTWRARIGIVLQNTKDLGQLSVAESLETIGAAYSNRRGVAEVAELVGLTDRLSTRGSALSGGLRRRLDVGLGLIGRPELLFLDEPTTGFDPQARRQFWELIKRLNADGMTILLTTHYLDEAEALADRVGVIAAGALLAVSTPDELGGRRSGTTEISWRGADGAMQTESTQQPSERLRQLLAEHAGELDDLRVHRPTLEDIYLDMIGDQQ